MDTLSGRSPLADALENPGTTAQLPTPTCLTLLYRWGAAMAVSRDKISSPLHSGSGGLVLTTAHTMSRQPVAKSMYNSVESLRKTPTEETSL